MNVLECHRLRSRDCELPWPVGVRGRSWQSRQDIARQIYGLEGELPLCMVGWVARAFGKETATSEGVQRGCG